MDELEALDKLHEIHDYITTKYVTQIVKIFEDYFTSENVDYQPNLDFENFELAFRPYLDESGNINLTTKDIYNLYNPIQIILVRFSEITVTNEYGKSTTIKNFFAKVTFRIDGTIVSISFNRSHYTYVHFINNYMHSHVNSIPVGDFTKFQNGCFGTGPIKSTITELSIGFDESQWMQLCWDLDKYVRIESVSGVPYHRLTECGNIINTNIPLYIGDDYIIEDFNSDYGKFITWVIENHLDLFKFCFSQCWQTADSNVHNILTLNNLFKEFSEINEIPLENYCILTAQKEENLYQERSKTDTINNINNFRGSFICMFKGEEIRLDIDNPQYSTDSNLFMCLTKKYVDRFFNILIITLNNEYGK